MMLRDMVYMAVVVFVIDYCLVFTVYSSECCSVTLHH
jgi:hypothetical protein